MFGICPHFKLSMKDFEQDVEQDVVNEDDEFISIEKSEIETARRESGGAVEDFTGDVNTNGSGLGLNDNGGEVDNDDIEDTVSRNNNPK